jgi:transcriptional regulator with XRE-family HTH domain
MGRPINIEKKCAGNVKLYRIKNNLSQADVAKKANLSVSYVSMLERGERVPPLKTLAALARTFKIQPAALIS